MENVEVKFRILRVKLSVARNNHYRLKGQFWKVLYFILALRSSGQHSCFLVEGSQFFSVQSGKCRVSGRYFKLEYCRPILQHLQFILVIRRCVLQSNSRTRFTIGGCRRNSMSFCRHRIMFDIITEIQCVMALTLECHKIRE